jgi:hypothetical protein
MPSGTAGETSWVPGTGFSAPPDEPPPLKRGDRLTGAAGVYKVVKKLRSMPSGTAGETSWVPGTGYSAPPDEPPPLKRGDRLTGAAGVYKVVKKLGGGAYGTVYKCKMSGSGRRKAAVAVKISKGIQSLEVSGWMG